MPLDDRDHVQLQKIEGERCDAVFGYVAVEGPAVNYSFGVLTFDENRDEPTHLNGSAKP